MSLLPPLHVVTDDGVLARADFLAAAARVLEAGRDSLAFHLRGPAAPGRRMHDLAVALGEVARGTGSLLVVNDRLDVALAAGAHGVHLGARSLSVADARAVAGDAVLVGASVHAAGEAGEAARAGADYVFAGNVYATASHPGRPGVGPGLVYEAAEDGIAVVAIGGVTPERVAELRHLGAAGVAAVRAVWDAPDPAAAVERFLEAWQGRTS